MDGSTWTGRANTPRRQIKHNTSFSLNIYHVRRQICYSKVFTIKSGHHAYGLKFVRDELEKCQKGRTSTTMRIINIIHSTSIHRLLVIGALMSERCLHSNGQIYLCPIHLSLCLITWDLCNQSFGAPYCLCGQRFNIIHMAAMNTEGLQYSVKCFAMSGRSGHFNYTSSHRPLC